MNSAQAHGRHPFMGRQGILGRFEETIALPPDKRRLWFVFGPGGIGKTWLLKELEKRALDNHFLTAYVDLELCRDPYDLVSVIEDIISDYGDDEP